MWDFGRAELVEPEAIGEPGKRRFRLRVMSGSDAASLWLEKEQLAALTLAIRQLLEQTGEADQPVDDPSASGPFPGETKVDFKIGRMGIGYDESKHMVVIFAYTIEDDENAPPSFTCQVSRNQSRVFAEQAEETIDAGRPVCVLCGEPTEPDGAHTCQRRNGHSDQPIALHDE